MNTKKYKVIMNGTELELVSTSKGYKIDNYLFTPKVIKVGNSFKVFIEEDEYTVKHKGETILLNGEELEFDYSPSPVLLNTKQSAIQRELKVTAAIPGTVVEIRVEIGQKIKEQDCLLILESMKMRNEIVAPINGVIEQIAIEEGMQVSAKQLLMKLAPLKESK
jgi:biotin carboxyl carrier protein